MVFCFFVLWFAYSGRTQVFVFPDTSALIVKTPQQSPAHWYLEIISNASTDTTLRWITRFENIPAEWIINFDDQNTNITPVHHLDSADFVMHPTIGLPQKLIIGAVLNNTPGHGIIYFDIFNPANRSEFQTISYEYLISSVGITERALPDWLEFDNNEWVVSGDKTEIVVLDALGRLVVKTKNHLPVSLLEKDLYISFQSDNRYFFTHVLSANP